MRIDLTQSILLQIFKTFWLASNDNVLEVLNKCKFFQMCQNVSLKWQILPNEWKMTNFLKHAKYWDFLIPQGFTLWQTDRLTDISDSTVTFVTENYEIESTWDFCLCCHLLCTSWSCLSPSSWPDQTYL